LYLVRKGGREGVSPDIGDGDQFDQQFVDLFVQAERVAARIVGRGEAEDVAAETLVRALLRWPKVASYAIPWVTKVASNLAVDRVRKGAKQLPPPPFARAAEDNVDDRLLVVDELRRLSRRQREVMVLRHLVGLSDAETAASLGLSVDSVKTHGRRALTQLRRHARLDQEVPCAS
jgi:RNA polymerase sigma factor (sigma-70 family)